MTTTYRLNVDELDNKFITSVKKMYKGKHINITIFEEIDETDYLLSSKKNAERLLKSIVNINDGIKLKEIDIESIADYK